MIDTEKQVKKKERKKEVGRSKTLLAPSLQPRTADASALVHPSLLTP